MWSLVIEYIQLGFIINCLDNIVQDQMEGLCNDNIGLHLRMHYELCWTKKVKIQSHSLDLYCRVATLPCNLHAHHVNCENHKVASYITYHGCLLVLYAKSTYSLKHAMHRTSFSLLENICQTCRFVYTCESCKLQMYK